MRSCNWIVLISRLAKFIGPYGSFCGSPVLKTAWKGKSYTSVFKSTVRNTPPHRLTAYFPLVCDYSRWGKLKKLLRNYLERQKVRNLRSSLRKQPTFRDATTGFLRLVGRGGGGHRLPTVKHFSVSLSFLKSKGQEKPLSILPAGYSEDISGLMELSREFARNPLYVSGLWGNSSELATAPLACMTRSSTILPLISQWVLSHKSFRLCC